MSSNMGFVLITLPKLKSDDPSLTDTGISIFQLNDKNKQELWAVLASNTHLEKLRLWDTTMGDVNAYLYDNDISELAAALEKNPNSGLKSLDLSGHRMTQVG